MESPSYTALHGNEKEKESAWQKVERASHVGTRWSGGEEEGVTAGLLDAESSGVLWITEVRAQARLAWPMMLTNLLSFSFIIVAVMFVGHLGELELSSASIANSFGSVTGFSVMVGLSSALETFCGQAYGAKAYHLMGVQLQAAAIVTYSFCIPIGTLWWNLEAVLLWLGQDPQISKMAASYLRFSIPGLLSAAMLQPLIRFLQTQSLVLPTMACSILTATLHPFICYLVIYRLGFGYHGGAFSIMISYWLLLLLVVTYIIWSGKCSETWSGFKLWEAARAVPLYLKMAIPGLIMVCLEFWSFEIMVLLSGLLPNPQLELSVLSIYLNTTSLIFMIPLGFGVAVSTRVSNALGRNEPNAAQLAVRVVLVLVMFQALTVSIIMLLLRNLWPHTFTNVEEVVTYVSSVMPLLAVSTFMDSIQAVLSGVVRGCGRQTLGAGVNLGAYYIVGTPFAVFYGFYLHLGGRGLIFGLISGILVQTTLLLSFILRTDWKHMADDAQERLRKQATEPRLPRYLEGLQES